MKQRALVLITMKNFPSIFNLFLSPVPKKRFYLISIITKETIREVWQAPKQFRALISVAYINRKTRSQLATFHTYVPNWVSSLKLKCKRRGNDAVYRDVVFYLVQEWCTIIFVLGIHPRARQFCILYIFTSALWGFDVYFIMYLSFCGMGYVPRECSRLTWFSFLVCIISSGRDCR